MGIGMIILAMIYSATFHDGKLGPVKTTRADCYDEYRNKIIGLDCETVVLNGVYIIPVLMLVIGTFIIFISCWYTLWL